MHVHLPNGLLLCPVTVQVSLVRKTVARIEELFSFSFKDLSIHLNISSIDI